MNRFLCSAGLRAGILLGLLAGPARSADWPAWRGPNGNGIAGEPLPAEADFENVAWRAQIGIGFSSIAVAWGRAFAMGHDGKTTGGREWVRCFDAVSGELLWEDAYEADLMPNLHEGGPGAAPVVDGDHLFILSRDGQLRSYEAATGKKLWQRNMMAEAGLKRMPEWGFAGAPLAVRDHLYVEAGATFCLDKANGEVIWKSQPFRPAYGSPVYLRVKDSERIAVLKTDGLAILDAGTGGTVAFSRWETDFSTNATTPVVRGAQVFISTGYDRGAALFELGERHMVKRYENRVMCNHMNNPVLVDGCLYGFDGTAHRGRPTEFVCMDFDTGAERWRAPASEGLGCGSVIAAANGMLVILSEKGELVLARANPDGFEVRQRAQVLGGRCWTSPVLANGRIYCRNSRGDLACVDLRAENG